jgi:hypothetical protein
MVVAKGIHMPNRAKLYITAIIVLGFSVLLSTTVLSWHSSDPYRWASYLAITILASSFKVRLPGLTGTISLNFLFVLIGLSEFSISETVLLACAGAVIQSVWRTKTRPKLVRLSFNTSVLAISAALAHRTTHLLLAGDAARYLPILLTTSATVYFFSNTLLVSGVISLVESRSLRLIWQQCHLWTFPYYLAGGAIAGLISVSSRTVGWQLPMLSLPMTYFVYRFYRLYVDRLGLAVKTN